MAAITAFIAAEPLLAIGLAVGGGFAAAKQFSGGDDVKLPAQRAESAKRTAEPVEQVSEQARRNRRRRASLLTRDFAPPQLSTPELLGLGN